MKLNKDKIPQRPEFPFVEVISASLATTLSLPGTLGRAEGDHLRSQCHLHRWYQVMQVFYRLQMGCVKWEFHNYRPISLLPLWCKKWFKTLQIPSHTSLLWEIQTKQWWLIMTKCLLRRGREWWYKSQIWKVWSRYSLSSMA